MRVEVEAAEYLAAASLQSKGARTEMTMTLDRPTDRVAERLIALRADVERLDAEKRANDEAQITILFEERPKAGEQARLAKRAGELGRELADARDQLARISELHDVAVRQASRAEFADIAVARTALRAQYLPIVRKLRDALETVGELSEQITTTQRADELHAHAQYRATQAGHFTEHVLTKLPYAAVLEPQVVQHRLHDIDDAIAAAHRPY